MQLVIAAALAVVAALAEFTIVPYLKIGDAVLQPVLVFGVIWTIAGGLEAGLVWAFVGGLALDILGQRPLGSSAFSMLVAIGLASVIGGLLSRVKIIAPVIATAIVSPVYSMLLLVTITALSSAPLSSAAFDSVLPTAIYNTVLAAHRRTADRRHRHAPPGRRAGGLVNDSLVTPNRERDRRPIRFLVFGIITILVFGDADDSPGLPPDHERRRCRRPRRGTADRGSADSRDPRPDLRPTGPPARQQRRHLGREDHAVRPAVLRARRRLAASGEPPRHGGVGDPHHARYARPAPGSTRSASPRTCRTRRPASSPSRPTSCPACRSSSRRGASTRTDRCSRTSSATPDPWTVTPTRSCAARATSRTT